MTRINLLPWRETRIRELDTRFHAIVGVCLVVTLIVLVCIQMVFSHFRQQQTERNQFIQTRLEQLNQWARQAESLKKTLDSEQSTLDKLVSIQHLRTDRLALMVALAERIPAQVYLTEWTETNNTPGLSGRAQSEAVIADFLHQLASIPLIHKAELNSMENDPQGVAHHYPVRFWIKLTTRLDEMP